ncbi:MAG: hypothetical protein ABUT39_23575 [Acidobacteriota bacterium]
MILPARKMSSTAAVALLAAACLLLPSGASAYHGTILKPEFRGWSRDGTKCVLIKRVETSENDSFEELLVSSLNDGKLVVERHGLHWGKQRPEYMDEYEGPTLSEFAAEERIRRLDLQPGTLLSLRVEGDRTWIPIPAEPPESRKIGIQLVHVMEGESNYGISYTAFQRVWLEKNLLFKSSRARWDEGGLPTGEVLLASLSPNRRYLLILTQTVGYSTWFEFFFIDLVRNTVVERRILSIEPPD